ncbi:exonuclease [Microbacterium phage Kozie]|uniref:Exonuclease n=1 Tax=Microbacterium phage Kozie TaxID=2885981 RepID=A0AAE9C3S3_9CAUD|nr:exonuclease [Microbacterium phage Kozie]UDL16241.1 exonuclease [Microbacterium phage Kozie]
MTATITSVPPIPGPTYDRARPETRQAWWDFRLGGLTATDIRDWPQGSKRRRILQEKVTGDSGDEPNVFAWRHGSLREAEIAAWAQANYGITPTGATYASGVNPRWIASPDGVMIDPFTGRYEPGTEDSIVLEIKTAVDDLTPGEIDAARVLTALNNKSMFVKRGYYRQVQWQMLVMNATRTLFVWERHDGKVDPETTTYSPIAPPEAVWIMRDQAFIDALAAEAEEALAEIDAARLAYSLDGLPPASPDLPSEHAILVADYFKGLDGEKIGTAAKKKAWDALTGIYLAEDAPDVAIDAGFAKITVSSKTGQEPVVDADALEADEEYAAALAAVEEANAALAASPLIAAVDDAKAAVAAILQRHTSYSPTRSRKLTITRPRV